MDILNDILRQSFLIFLWVGSTVGILIGAGMLFKPEQVVQLNQYFSRWIGSEKLGSVLDRPHWIERPIYRHHRLLGVGVLIGATVVLDTFLFSYNPRTISAFIPRGYWWLSDALMGMLIVGSVIAALVGLIVLIKPSLLRDIETSANRWISDEHLLSLMNGMNHSFERSIFQHSRLAGISIMLGSLYVLVVLGYFLFLSAWKI